LFAIGDIHGCADELRLLLERIPRTSETTIVFLGDYIDRGPSSRAVIETVLELAEQCHVVALRGNHEAMLLDYLDAPQSAAAATFVYNGGSATLASYADARGHVQIPDAHIAFFRELPIWHQTERAVFVHAGLPQRPLGELDPERDGPTMLWTRGGFLKTKYDWGKVVIHGHTPVPRVTVWPNRINLDTGCVFNGKLTALEVPGQTCFSVRRLPARRRIVLPDRDGRREAHRFVGSIPVRVKRGDRIHVFVTVDYSEVGMYLRSVDVADNARFEETERIEGVVGPETSSPVSFSGIIVRKRIDDNGVHYGVKVLDTAPFDPHAATGPAAVGA